jgi:hypothetical protein|tara:strand:- start:370 stop:612 length:243 start_codon:yes stop_codon:yes gene_type:complete
MNFKIDDGRTAGSLNKDMKAGYDHRDNNSKPLAKGYTDNLSEAYPTKSVAENDNEIKRMAEDYSLNKVYKKSSDNSMNQH